MRVQPSRFEFIESNRLAAQDSPPAGLFSPNVGRIAAKGRSPETLGYENCPTCFYTGGIEVPTDMRLGARNYCMRHVAEMVR